MKLLIATISLQLMLWGVQAEQLKLDEGQKPVRIHSFHIPPWVQSDLHLAPNELKLFAGHAIGIIRAKCPSVDNKKLFQIQKYIGKIIATDLSKKDDESSNPSESDTGSDLEIVPKTTGRLQFPELLTTLYRCSQEKEEVSKAGRTVAVKDREGVVTLVRANVGEPSAGTGAGAKAPNVFLGFHDRDLSQIVKKSGPTGLKVQKAEMKVPVIELHAIPREEKAKEKATITAKPAEHSETKEKEKPKKESHNSFFNWVSSVFSSMHSMFSRIFKDGFGRRRRSIEFLPESPESPEAREEPEADFDASGMSSLSRQEGGGSETKGAKWIEQDKVRGQEAIGSLIDETCRLFCGKCHTPQQIRNFRSAGKELMDYIMADENVLIVASHILDEPFLDTIRSCGRDIDLTPFASLLSYPEEKSKPTKVQK